MTNTEPLKIIFFGTPKFGRIILEKLIEANYKPILVVTAPDKPAGRKQELIPSPVKQLAEACKISALQPERFDQHTIRDVQSINPDLIIVAAYGQIIPKKILEIPKYGTLNVHPSLLPRWRGPSPIQYAIRNGDNETGITIMLMDEKIDHGPIVANAKCQMPDARWTTDELSKELAELGAQLLTETIPQWVTGEITPKEQDHKNATYSKILTKEDGHIDWSKSAEEIERQIRAFTHWPGSFTFWNDHRIEIAKGYPLPLSSAEKLIPGQIFSRKKGEIAIQTGRGVFIVEKLQIAGKNEMTAQQFLNGYSEIIGAILQ